jgi:hypothetical protein
MVTMVRDSKLNLSHYICHYEQVSYVFLLMETQAMNYLNASRCLQRDKSMLTPEFSVFFS